MSPVIQSPIPVVSETDGSEPGIRDAGGRFVKGHPGGPGRPRRAVETEYLSTLADACPPETWRDVCLRAVQDAKGGDAKAREWLSRYLLGKEPQSLLDLTADEQDGFSPADAVVEAGKQRREERLFKSVFDGVGGGATQQEDDEEWEDD